MNAVEIARQRAEELHLAACAQGGDPWNCYGFACAEAERRDIEVTRLPKGDVRLHGGRALYNPEALVILHEDTGSRFLDAFLVAHELGHVELEGKTGFDVAISPDPSRPAEGTPVGMERVSDYGEKERREVRMDLFAREFLLPRSVARRLHVEDRLTATQISERLGADFRVVATQLLDALLLPAVTPDSTEPRTEKPLNDAQARAAAHRGRPYLLEAGPGTGKTQTLVARIGLLLEDGVDPASILILTFSNKAAAELSERIAAKWPEAAAVIWVGTFHAFGLDVVRRFHHLLDLPANPRLMDRAEAVELLEEEFPKLNLEHFRNLWDPTRQIVDILSAISRAKDEMAGPAKYAELAEAMAEAVDPEAQEVARRSAEVAIVYLEYERLKSARQCLDFGDLVMVPAALCTADATVRDALRARHQHVLVDEFQDVNRASVTLLKALVGTGENLWAVGDARQSVYRFRGASPYNMALFDRDFSGAARGQLQENYRSSSAITRVFERFANSGMRASGGRTVSFEARRGSCGYAPQHREVPAGTEVAAVAEAVEEMRAAGFAYRQQAILCAGNERLARLAVGLEALGIPVLYLGSLFERPEVKDLLSLVSLLVDGWGAGLYRAGAMSAFSTSLAKVEVVLTLARDGGARPLEWPRALAGEPASAGGLQTLASLYEGMTPGTDPWIFLARVLLDKTRIAAEIAASRTVDGRFRGIAIWQFMNFVRNQPDGSGPPASRLLDRVRKLVLLAEERDLRQLPEAGQGMDAVRLMTIHGSKGLEFPVVHIHGLNQGSLPRSSGRGFSVPPPDGMVEGAAGTGLQLARDSHEEEQECLFFVALSRARDQLITYSVATKSDGKRWPKSPFLDRLGSTVRYQSVKPRGEDPVTADSEALPVLGEGPIALTDRQVALYLKCPRRFFYTHLLRTGGRRSETAYMRMHTAVQNVVEWVLEQPTAPDWEAVAIRLDTIWHTHGPGDHGYAAQFRAMALGLLANLLKSRAGCDAGTRTPLRFRVDGGEIIVIPDEVLQAGMGVGRVRRIWTGHKGYGQEEGVQAALQALAARQLSRSSRAELVHLGDGTVTPVEMSEQKLENRRRKVEAVVAHIRQGHFPADPENPRDCPRCPSFFICGPVPSGEIDLKKISA